MSNDNFRNIGLIGRVGNERVVESVRSLAAFLQQRDLSVILEDEIASVLPGHGFRVSTRKLMGEICDLVIVVGGDGSMLGAARALARHDVPVLGVNRGRLGFLTDISPIDIEAQIGAVLDGHYTIESRFLLDAVHTRGGEPIGKGDAFNDVVVSSGETARMMEFELYIEGDFVYRQRGDGLIVSTPTGSTAYSLSGGGPIMHPKLDALVLVPMFPHMLSSRPLVVDGNSEIKIVITDGNPVNPRITCDGQSTLIARPGDVIYVHKKPHKLKLIHPLNHDFYTICRSKLGWSRTPSE